MKEDHDMVMVRAELIEYITNYLLENAMTYAGYITGGVQRLMDEALAFFTDRNYKRDFCDILVKLVADALGINIKIYTKQGKQVRYLQVKSNSPLARKIHLKYFGEHYEAVVQIKPLPTPSGTVVHPKGPPPQLLQFVQTHQGQEP